MRKCFLFTLTCLMLGPATAARAQEEGWEQNTPYYEDDAWYDISEWFDGNDYNPTDEVAGRWDDEVYSAQQDTGSDTDNDTWYGYDSQRDNDNWFYDYYDYEPSYGSASDGNYDYTYGYYDFDGDGYYDAYTYGLDSDNDGTFESTSYYSLNRLGKQQRQQDTNAQSSRQHEVTGSIERIKNVHVGNRKHILLEVQDQDGQTSFVDIGRGMKLKDVTLQRGDRVTASGPKIKVGDRSVLVARHLEANGESTDIDRKARTYPGEIAGTRRQKIRGTEHQLAILMNPDSRTKRIVDLGPAKQLDVDLKEGDQVSVTGMPVKIGDRRVVLAREIQVGDQPVEIDRNGSSARNNNS